MARTLHPRHCTVHAVELDGRGGAVVRMACSTGPAVGGQVEYQSRKVKASSVRFRGLHVQGTARVGFVTSPAQAVCRKDGREISCKLVGDKSSASLEGLSGTRQRLYVGKTGGGGREVFKSSEVPTEASHGKKYGYVIGPFKTKRGAEVMVKYGANNPHIRSVADAERLAKQGLSGHRRR